MNRNLSDGQNGIRDKALLPVWICFLWICAAPFLSLYRTGPLSSFYLEAGSLLGAAALLLASAHKGLLNTKLPAVSIGLILMAAFWWLQARILNLSYPGMSDMAVWTFIILALFAWACRGWVAEYGQEKIVDIFAWSILAGALIQAAIAFMQFKGWSAHPLFHGIIANAGSSVNGQLGQRNHLGHYLMWGVFAAAYLWSGKKMPAAAGFLTVFFLTGILGLVNSRTILGYVIGAGLILPVWRFLSGRTANRTVLIFLFAAILTAAFQFSMAGILELFGNTHYETAVERAGNSGFEGSMRQIEWRKAWIAFQDAPLLGHGWNSFALQTFLINAQQQYFPNNILGVLFTHSHNIIMQLLAEVGLAGTLLTAATAAAGIWRILSRPHTNASLLLLCTLSVSICHSMLEYPLWYIYFLTPFSLMFALAPARPADISNTPAHIRRNNLAAGAAALLIITGILNLGLTYTRLNTYSSKPKNETAAESQRKIRNLIHISQTSPMLAYYADLSLSKRADPADDNPDPQITKAAQKALSYRPYANTYQAALYLYRQGKTEEGAKWMQAAQYYYPYMMHFYAQKIRSRPEYAPLLPKLLQDCQSFNAHPKHSTAKPCTP